MPNGYLSKCCGDNFDALSQTGSKSPTSNADLEDDEDSTFTEANASDVSSDQLRAMFRTQRINLQKDLQVIVDSATSEIKSSIRDLAKRISSVETVLGDLGTRVSFMESMPAIEDHPLIITMQKDIKSANAKNSIDPRSFDMLHLQEIFCSENRNRDRRSRNLLIFGLPESTDDDTVERDLAATRKCLSAIPDLGLDSIRVTRIGAASPGKLRPLCVTLPQPADVFRVIGHRNLLPASVSVASDKSSGQRDYLKFLHERIDAHNNDHPDDILRLKYSLGTPSVFNKSNKIINPKTLRPGTSTHEH